MITCLNNLIGVRNLAGYENPDWAYINDLQGITTDQLEKISDNEDQYEARITWDEIYDRSARLFESDLRKELKKYFKNYTFVDNRITSYYYDEKETIPQESFWNGWYFDLGYQYKNVALNFNDFTIYLNTAGTFTLKIFNLVTGEELYTEDYQGVAGTNTFRINQTFPLWKYSKLFIAYDASEVDTIKSNTYEEGLLSHNYSYIWSVRKAKINKASSIVSSNLSTTETNTGLIINYNIKCSIDNFVCSRIDLFKQAFLYKLGIEFCRERLYSSRINRWTLLNRDRAKELLDEFKEEYMSQIKGIMDGIQVDDGGMCFECNKKLSYKFRTP